MSVYLDDSAFAPGMRKVEKHDYKVDFSGEPLAASDMEGAFDASAGNAVKFNLDSKQFKDCENAIMKASGKKKKENPCKTGMFTPIGRAVAQSLKDKYFAGFLKSAHFTKFLELEAWFENHEFDEFDFEIFRVLGRGGFGLVNGCRDVRTGKVYAMKTMDKRRVKLNGGEQMCIYEKELLSLCDSPFVLDLKYSFSNQFEIFIIMDVKAGGDLNFHLHERKKFSEAETMYYIARTCEGMQAIHDCGWVYRDLKPENLLLGNDGKCNISDLGLACPVPKGGLMKGIAGTPGYWAPEMLRKEDYGVMVDYWTLGVCFVEFLTGSCPFRSKGALKFGKSKNIKDPLQSCNLAVKEMEIEFDSMGISDLAKDLAKQLLDRDPSTRLGKNGLSDIKNHPYFATFDWDSVTDGTMEPPFVPDESGVNSADADSIGTFQNDAEVQDVQLKEKDHSKYTKFPHKGKKAFEIDCVGFLIWEEKNPKEVDKPASKACVIS